MLARIGTGLSLLFLIAVLAVSVGGLKAHASDVAEVVNRHCDVWVDEVVFYTAISLQEGKTPAELKKEARQVLGDGTYEAAVRLIDIINVKDEEAAKTVLDDLHKACVVETWALLEEQQRKARI